MSKEEKEDTERITGISPFGTPNATALAEFSIKLDYHTPTNMQIEDNKKDKTSLAYNIWVLIHELMTRNSFKRDLTLTKIFFITILCMPLGVLSIEYSFNSINPLLYEVIGTILLAIPAFAMLLRGYYEHRGEGKE